MDSSPFEQISVKASNRQLLSAVEKVSKTVTSKSMQTLAAWRAAVHGIREELDTAGQWNNNISMTDGGRRQI